MLFMLAMVLFLHSYEVFVKLVLDEQVISDLLVEMLHLIVLVSQFLILPLDELNELTQLQH